MDVALGVREWNRRGRSCSGGFDSYTKVSSESEEFASSTALATLASKISALEEAGRCLVSKREALYKFKLGLREDISDNVRSGLVESILPLRGEGPCPHALSGDRAEYALEIDLVE